MENIVMIIATIMGFILAIISYIMLLINESRYHRKDTHRFDEIDGQNKDLKTDHKSLSKEHGQLKRDLSIEHTALKNNLGEKLSEIKTRQGASSSLGREQAGVKLHHRLSQ